ncbi:MAG: NAD(P)-dependent oxidoreductase [Amphiplicatus sp.]
MADDSVIGFFGAGMIGAPIATRLASAGLAVRIWNRSAAKAEALRSANCHPVRDVRIAAVAADFVCLCLTDGKAADDLMFGESKLSEALSVSTIVIDFSTIGPESTREIAARVKDASGAGWLDCPVSGGVAGAQKGALTIFAGGDEEDFARALPVLRHVATNITRMGGVGAGQATKLCNQLIVASNLLAIAEATSLCEAQGMEGTKLAAALRGGFADSAPLQLFGPRMAKGADPGPKVSELKTLYKDVSLVHQALLDGDVHPFLTCRIDDAIRTLIEAGYGKEDVPALMRLYRQQGAVLEQSNG